MTEPRQSDVSPDDIDPPIDWERAKEQRELEASIDYMLSMSVAERLQRHQQAARVVRRLEAVAAAYGLRSMGWRIFGPTCRGVRLRTTDACDPG